MTVSLLLIILAASGLYISAYFTFVYYRIVRPDTRLIPPFCRMEGATCSLVIHHQAARLLGFAPNFVLGIAYYLALIALVAVEPANPSWWTVIAVLSWVPVVMAVYLVHVLVNILKIICPLCIASHIINICIAALLTFGR